MVLMPKKEPTSLTKDQYQPNENYRKQKITGDFLPWTDTWASC